MLHLMVAQGLTPTKLDTAPKTLDRSLRVRLGRLKPMWAAGRALARVPHGRGVLYASLSGGWGLVWEIALVGLARSKGFQLVLHHHSFRYIDAEFLPMRWLSWVAGRHALHLTLGLGMQRGLIRRYSGVVRTLVLSNAAFMGRLPIPENVAHNGPIKIGHLSNLCAAKGLVDVLDLAAICATRRLPSEFIIAGPFQFPSDEVEYRARIKALPNVRYLGPVYAASKQEFYAEIDVFLFPTRYANEAEPLVILEALQCGRPVVAYDRGCIATMLDRDCGLVVREVTGVATTVFDRLSLWQRNRGLLRQASEAARERFCFLQREAHESLQALIGVLGRKTPSRERAINL